MKKKLICYLLILCLLCTLIPTIAIEAKAESYSGECGENLTWTLDTDTGVLTISGTGAMTDYTDEGAPWYPYCDIIKTVIIGDGVTTIGNTAFRDYTAITEVTIPDSVTNIGTYAFYNCSGLTSLVIPDSVTEIGQAAFRGCSGLTSLKISDKLSSIEDSVFCACSNLTTVTIPGSVKRIGALAFLDCTNLTYVNISEGVNEICEWAFFCCTNLKFVVIPDSTGKIGYRLFSMCESLEHVHFVGNTAPTVVGDTFHGCPQDFRVCYGGEATWFTTGDTEYLYCSSCKCYYGECGDDLTWMLDTNTGVLTISGTGDMTDYDYEGAPWYPHRDGINTVIIGDGVTTIGSDAFFGCGNLTTVTIPDSVTEIGDYAFAECCSLNAIKIPDSVTSIGNNAFYCCESLTSMVIPDSVTTIGEYSFADCSGLTSLTISNNITSIPDDAFSRCSGLISVTIPNSVTSIGEYAFCGCSGLTSLVIPDSVTDIGIHAFNGCSGLTSVTLSDNLTVIAGGLFQNCSSLTTVTIPEGVTIIDGAAFLDCTNLSSIKIPEGVTSIGVLAFLNCTNLKSVTIPASVTFIDSRAFMMCTSLEHVHFLGDTMPTIGGIAFSGCHPNLRLCYIEGAQGWENCSYETEVWEHTYLTDGTTHTYICHYCDGIYSNGESFSGECGDNLYWKLDIDTGVLTISGIGEMPDFADEGAPWYPYRDIIKTVIVEDGVTSIGNNAFYGCTEMTEVSIPDSVTAIGNQAFFNCQSLTAVTIPDGVEVIKDSTFMYCHSLVSVTIPGSVETVETWAFGCCKDLVYVIFEDGVTVIDQAAFWNTPSLIAINLGNSVTTINPSAFAGSAMNHILFRGTEEEWAQIEDISNNVNLSTAIIHYNAVGDEIYWVNVDGEECLYCSICNKILPVVCDHSNTEIQNAQDPTCTEDGYSGDTVCNDCGRTVSEGSVIPATGHDWTYSNNGDDHTANCGNCGLTQDEEHTYENGGCVCGAPENTEPVEPTEVTIKIGHTVSFDSDLKMNYRIKYTDLAAAVPNYTMEGAYLTVEKDRYPKGGGAMTVETVTLYPDLTTDSTRVLFSLPGIQSVEMGSELRAVLHVFDSEGNEYVTAVDIYSILAYAELCFNTYNPSKDGLLFTMLIDCLNYGAAAQVHFDRRADELVNAGLDAYQQYASTQLSAELTDVRTYVDNDRTITAVTAIGFNVNFADKTEINAKLTIAEGYGKEDITSVKVLNEKGEVVDTLTQFTELDDGRLQVTFTGVKSANMRDMYYFVAYVGDQVASQNVGYSIEAYAKSNIGSSDAALSALVRNCIYYGDSAKVYFDSLIK